MIHRTILTGLVAAPFVARLGVLMPVRMYRDTWDKYLIVVGPSGPLRLSDVKYKGIYMWDVKWPLPRGLRRNQVDYMYV